MDRHHLVLDPRFKEIRQLKSPLGGTNREGHRLEVSNYSLEKDGRPWFGISGEFHYSRYDPRFWEVELVKMKVGGINLVATYVFWNHHEEVQGQFDWDGRRNLRRFVELCAAHDLEVIVRVGPFDHGEARNGGFPDWLYGQPFELRSNSQGYLDLVRRWYREIGKQLTDLSFFEGGPVVAFQIENEYEHSGAPWEMTTGVSNEWVPSGRDGNEHLLTLKQIAQEEGLKAPLYTCTAWGGAATPVPDMLPVWGGYAFWPWIFYGENKAHPATPEYVFRDHHNNQKNRTYNYEPRYQPEDYPYLCCEMGGGMAVFYKYRFVLPPESVAAMAVIKLAGGCNLLGYYMFHGGTNPLGRVVPFLNEHQVPKRSYDYQAALGEFGQPRLHYHQLRLLHLFLAQYGSEFAVTKTILPEGAEETAPLDQSSTRWSVRARGGSGFLFWNNYQDHDERPTQADRSFHLDFGPGIRPVTIPADGTISLAGGASGFLPFRWAMGATTLEYSTTQPVTHCVMNGREVWFFKALPGLEPEYAWGDAQDLELVRPGSGGGSTWFVMKRPDGSHFEVVTLGTRDAERFWKVDVGGKALPFLSTAVPLPGLGGAQLTFETDARPAISRLAPEGSAEPFVPVELSQVQPSVEGRFRWTKVAARKAVVTLAPAALADLVDLILRVEYTGDIGNAYVDSTLVSDNFANGAPWEIGVAHLPAEVFEGGLVIDVVPLKKGTKVVHETTMAGRSEVTDEEIGEILSITAVAVYRFGVEVSQL